MKKITKWMVATGILVGASVTSAAVFATADNGQYNQTPQRQTQQIMNKQTWQTHLQEQVSPGYLTQEEANERLNWMEKQRSICHNNSMYGETSKSWRNSGKIGQHHRQWQNDN